MNATVRAHQFKVCSLRILKCWAGSVMEHVGISTRVPEISSEGASSKLARSTIFLKIALRHLRNHRFQVPSFSFQSDEHVKDVLIEREE
jgi:hypothetical protein